MPADKVLLPLTVLKQPLFHFHKPETVQTGQTVSVRNRAALEESLCMNQFPSCSLKGGGPLRNDFQVVGDEVRITIPRRSVCDEIALINASDLPRAKAWGGKWYWRKGRILGRWKVEDGWRQEYLHRWIVQPPPGQAVIHLNDNFADCRRDNLLVVEDGLKTQHRRRTNSNGDNKHLNVYWIQSRQCWRVWVESGNEHRSAYFPKEEYLAAVEQAKEFRRELLDYSREALRD